MSFVSRSNEIPVYFSYNNNQNYQKIMKEIVLKPPQPGPIFYIQEIPNSCYATHHLLVKVKYCIFFFVWKKLYQNFIITVHVQLSSFSSECIPWFWFRISWLYILCQNAFFVSRPYVMGIKWGQAFLVGLILYIGLCQKQLAFAQFWKLFHSLLIYEIDFFMLLS